MDDSFDKTIAENGEGETHRYQLPVGSMLGMYRVIRPLGRGGMGEVYEVKHEVLTTRYAIKLLPSSFKEQRGFLERFKREAQVMAQLDHPNIIKVDDFAETDGKLWLRMELAKGIEVQGKQVISLADYAELLGGKIPQEEFVEYLIQILEGLHYAHSKGVIHRDMKPANILFSSQLSTVNRQLRTVKISDFGLVRLVGEDWVKSMTEKSVSLSMSLGDEKTEGLDKSGSSTRALLGTYEYMSPEQKRGEPADERSDIYALGLMVFKLLTGLTSLGRERIGDIDPRLCKKWDDLIDKAVTNDKEKRFKTAGTMLEMVMDIEKAISGRGEEEKRKQEAEARRRQAEKEEHERHIREEENRRREEERRAKEQGGRDARLGRGSRDEREREKVEPGRKKSSYIILLVILIVGLFLMRDFIFRPQKEAEISTIVTATRPEALNKESTTSSMPAPETTTVPSAIVTTAPLLGRLTVEAEPGEARIKILNIRERYKQGMELQAGDYEIEVSALGYETARRKIHIEAGVDKVIEIQLAEQVIITTSSIEKTTTTTESFKTSFTNTIGMKFEYIRPGTFMMGSPKSESGRDDDETQHQVTLTEGFYMQTTEVTVDQWRNFIESTGYNTEAETGGGSHIWDGNAWVKKDGMFWNNPGFSQTGSHPVTCVTWNDAQEFIKWLGKKEGKRYRLPTEAEWEYACRAGNRAARPWGEDPDRACRYANVADRTAKVQFSGWTIHNCEDGYVYTAPVGRYEPNSFGLYDMIGNVWEWCEDWYGEYPSGSVRDPEGPSSGSLRVYRGGSWYNDARNCRSAVRGRGSPGGRGDRLGFRLARTE